MMNEPWFWHDNTISAKFVRAVLSPISSTYQFIQDLKIRSTHAAKVGAPVICIGNARIGGVGKTPFSILLGDLLSNADYDATFLSRGFGSQNKNPLRVDPNNHTARDVGDEPLLLARTRPCWVSPNRPRGATAILADKSQKTDVIILDDGFQNPSLKKDYALLLVPNNPDELDYATFPAGPMRETLMSALSRANALVIVKENKRDTIHPKIMQSANGIGLFEAWVEPAHPLPVGKVIAFTGIANPSRFFQTAETCGLEVIEKIAFPDHHHFLPKEIDRLKTMATRQNAQLITTEKDFVRLADEDKKDIETLKIRMKVDKADALRSNVIGAIEQWRKHDKV